MKENPIKQVRLSRDIHKQLMDIAYAENISLTKFINAILTDYLKGGENEKDINYEECKTFQENETFTETKQN